MLIDILIPSSFIGGYTRGPDGSDTPPLPPPFFFFFYKYGQMKYILGPFPPRNQSNMSPFFWSENTCTTGSILKSLMSHTTISKTFDNLGYSWSFLSNSYINTIQLGFLIWTFIKSFLVNNSINSNGSFSEKKKK